MTEDGDWSESEHADGHDGGATAAANAMQNEATAAYIEWQKSKKTYEDEATPPDPH